MRSSGIEGPQRDGRVATPAASRDGGNHERERTRADTGAVTAEKKRLIVERFREWLLGRLPVEMLFPGHGFFPGLPHDLIPVLRRGVDRVEFEIGGL